MDVTNNSTIDSVIDFANAKFGMELTKDQISSQLRELSFAETLKLLNSIKQDDNDAFSQIIDLSAVSEGYKIMPPMDPKYVERDGLEGPFTALSGKVVYYDPKEGKYYDPDTDIYMSYDEWQEHNNDHRGMKDERDEVPEARSSASDQAAAAGAYNGGKSISKRGNANLSHKLKGKDLEDHRAKRSAEYEAELEKARSAQRAKFDAMKKEETNEASDELARLIELSRHGIESIPEAYGTISSAGPSRATIRAGSTKADTQNRRANNANQDANRDAARPNRTVAGSNMQPTGQGANRAGSTDPDDIERAQNSDTASTAASQSNVNAQEIERLKQLAMGN